MQQKRNVFTEFSFGSPGHIQPNLLDKTDLHNTSLKMKFVILNKHSNP